MKTKHQAGKNPSRRERGAQGKVKGQSDQGAAGSGQQSALSPERAASEQEPVDKAAVARKARFDALTDFETALWQLRAHVANAARMMHDDECPPDDKEVSGWTASAWQIEDRLKGVFDRLRVLNTAKGGAR
jgi:hypothetical protein